MIKSIKNKYNTFIPGEFLPIYVDGKLANRNDFHAYKAKTALKAIGTALAPAAQRIDDFFVNH